MTKKRKPTHPGKILDELYIKPLQSDLQILADRLGIAQNALCKIRAGRASVTPSIAFFLAEVFDTTPQLWLNLQYNYDFWMEEKKASKAKDPRERSRGLQRR